MCNYTVYAHETPNGKRYVGITSRDVKTRWSNGRGYKNNFHFWRAIQKYKWDNIEHYILFEELSKEDAENKEIELIALWNTTNPKYGYNHSHGGNGKGKVTEETKELLSKVTKEYFRTHTSPLLGKHLSEEAKLKLSKSRMGMKWSPEQREKALKSRKENPYHHSEESIRKIKTANAEHYKRMSKAVCQYDLCGNFIAVFPSIREASRTVGVNRQQLSSCCNGASLSAGGYYWKFIEEEIVDYYKPKQKRSTSIPTAQKYQQYSLDGVLLCNYDSIDDLRNSGYELDYVRRCCNGKRKTYKGYIWKYREDDV